MAWLSNGNIQSVRNRLERDRSPLCVTCGVMCGVGALFDLYADTQQDLPFRVTVRFRDIPKDVLPCMEDQVVETAYFRQVYVERT